MVTSTGRPVRAGAAGGVRAASKPAANARSDASTPLPDARTASSNRSRSKGSAPEPARAPNREALMTLPASLASALKSALISCLAAATAAASRVSESTRPSPSLIFSVTE